MNQLRRVPRRWVLVFVALAVVVYLAATVSLTVEASEDATLEGDIAVATAVQRISLPGVDVAVEALNWLGKPIPLAVLAGGIALGLLALRRPAEALLVLPTTFSHAVNWALKQAAESPRPTPDVVRVTDQAHGFGFPSGHTMATVVFCGVVLYLAWRLIPQRTLRLAVQGLALAVVAGMGLARIYSGAHWPSDVLGGVLWGSFYTALLVLLFHRVRPGCPRRELVSAPI